MKEKPVNEHQPLGDSHARCRLCCQIRKLSNSHIIPEFFYDCIYDDKHRLNFVSGGPTKAPRPEQKGLREYLLCDKCETQLSKHEGYVRRVMYGGADCHKSRVGDLYVLTGLNYQHIRLCYLSILWRMSVSRHPFFSEVTLGRHEEIIRNMLLHGDAGLPEHYGFLGFVPFINGKFHSDLITQPECVKHCGHRLYRVVIGGLLIVFFVSSHHPPQGVKDFFPQPDGKWSMIGKDIGQLTFLAEWFVAVAKKHNDSRH